MMIRQNSGLLHVQFIKFPVVLSEFPYFILFLSKRLYRTHPGQILLGHRIQSCRFLTDLVIDLSQSLLHTHSAYTDHWKKNQGHQCQQRI